VSRPHRGLWPWAGAIRGYREGVRIPPREIRLAVVAALAGPEESSVRDADDMRPDWTETRPELCANLGEGQHGDELTRL
jgi:hypothetical protein